MVVPTHFIGVDPGKAGAWALLASDGRLIEVVKMPATRREMLLLAYRWKPHKPVATVERVWAGGRGMGAMGAFVYGQGFERILCAIEANHIPATLVVPQVWQAAMGCRTRGDKNVSKAAAVALFPEITVTHAIADALLIAEYGRRVAHGLIPAPGHSRARTQEK